jgi:S-DNA-T family DNA segregation ATPase FtsK/SpoIIIE
MPNRKVLDLQSDRIEMVLASHKAPARVTGGVVTPRVVQFHLAPAMGTKVNKLQALADDLALALGVPDVRVSRQGSSVKLEVPREDTQPVKLLPLIARLMQGNALHAGYSTSPAIPPFTAVLGLCDDGAPLLMRLSSPDVAHVLISGTTGSGKTAISQTMVLSLAMTHRRSQLQFVLIDPKRSAFERFAALPHMLWPIIGDAKAGAAALDELVRLMEARSNSGTEPRIVVVIDELADLMHANAAGKALADPLTRLVQRGREAGVHIVACTQKPSSQVLGPLIKANFPARLVGRVVSPEDARVASGIGGTGAERLTGHGDFLAVAAGQVVRFQAAYIGQAETAQIVAQMSSAPRRWDIVNGRPSLLHQAVALVARAS